MTSTSTRNSGRVNPPTIIKVEAGNRSTPANHASRAFMAGYMAARDAWLAGVERLPASTLMIVGGFTRPEFRVEVEVIAAVRV